MTLYKEGLAFRYVQGTKYHRDKPLEDRLGSIPAVENIKNYPDLFEKSLKYSYTVINSKSKEIRENVKRSLNGRKREWQKKHSAL